MPTRKKRNPADATLRNVRAANKKAAKTEATLTLIALTLASLAERVARLEKVVAKQK